MPVTDVSHDLDALTMTVVAEFAAPPERIWRLWSDPRQTERWWGPPEWPATFIRHDFREGGGAFYEMTGPDGEKSRGWWEIVSLDPPSRLVFRDGWANEDGSPSDFAPPTEATVTFEAIPSGTRMTNHTAFSSREALEAILGMGVEEGARTSLGQIDAILAAEA